MAASGNYRIGSGKDFRKIDMTLTNRMSRLVGRFANTRFPYWLQTLINRVYVRLLRVDLVEFDPPEVYPTLNALFGRRPRKLRDCNSGTDALIAPCDAEISGYGRLRGNSLLQVKGIDYSARDLLTEHSQHVDRVVDGAYITFYLSPGMYHGYHAPATFHVERLIHGPGTLWPVNSMAMRTVPGLFAKNERVILEGRRLSGQCFWMVFVGATNVGSITVDFEPSLQTNTGSLEPRVFDYPAKHTVNKGAYLGRFLMGSSVLLLAESQRHPPTLLGMSRVQVGDPLPWPASL